MTPPKHLWSGDWREDSAAAAEALNRRRPKSDKKPSSEAPTEVRPRAERPVRPPEAKPARAAETQPRPFAAPRPTAKPPAKPAPQSPPRTTPRATESKQRERQPRSSVLAGIDRRRGVRALVVFAISALLVAGGAIAIGRALGGDDKSPALSSSSRPWLGVQMENLGVAGVTVTTVSPGGPADNAGITPGDVITQIDNQPVNTTADVNAAISALRPGNQVEIQLQRGPVTYTTEATLAMWPRGTP